MRAGERDILDLILKNLDKLDAIVAKIDRQQGVLQTIQEHNQQHIADLSQQHKRMNDILGENTDQLKVHIARTKHLESWMENLEKRVMPLEEEKIHAVKSKRHHKERMMKVFYIIASLSAIASIIFGILKLL